MVHDLLCDFQLFYQMLVDDTKLEARCKCILWIQFDFDRTAEWTDCMCMLLNAAKSQLLHFGMHFCPFMLFPGLNSIPVPIPLAYHVEALGILVDSSFSPTA